MKYHIEKNSVQETLVIPLYGRKICSDRFPELFNDPDAAALIEKLDYDFAAQYGKMNSWAGLFGAVEVAQRQYDLAWEVRDYLTAHPGAAVVNLGCGLDTTFRRVDNGICRGYSLDLPDVIAIRDRLLPPNGRERSVACDLNDLSWLREIDAPDGAVFFAAGVFYYFRTEDVRRLLDAIARAFPGCRIAFDACGPMAARLMTRTWLKQAGITDVAAPFSVRDATELTGWSDAFRSVTGRGYMNGYRPLGRAVRPSYRLMARLGDGAMRMQIVRIEAK